MKNAEMCCKKFYFIQDHERHGSLFWKCLCLQLSPEAAVSCADRSVSAGRYTQEAREMATQKV